MSSSPCLLALLQSTSVTTGVMRVLQKESCVYHGDIVETVYICYTSYRKPNSTHERNVFGYDTEKPVM